MRCLKNMTTGKMASAINSVAFFAYANHKSDIQFTEAEQRAIYDNLIDAISEDFFEGKIVEALKKHLAIDIGDGKTAPIDELLKDAFKQLAVSISAIEKVSSTRNKNSLANEFKKAVGSETEEIDVPFYMSVLNNYVGKHDVKPATTLNTEDAALGTEQVRMPASTVQPAEPETINALLKRLFEEGRNMAYIDPALAHFNHIVATTWVDGRVIDGTTRGFTSLGDIALNVKVQLQERIYNFFATRSNGTVSLTQNGVETKYIMINTDRGLPVDFVQIKASEDGSVIIGSHKTFNSITSSDGTVSDVRFIIAPTLEAATTELATFGTVDNLVPNTSEETDFLKISITNADQLHKRDLPVFYSNIITTGKNFPVFLKAQFPTLDEAYKNTHKTSFSEPGSTSGPDQDSASLKLHKQSTPRLVMSLSEELSVDEESPYLTVEDFNLVAQELSSMPSDAASISIALLAAAKNAPNTHKKSILYSIYYRFFSPSDYDVAMFKDPTTAEPTTVKLRSYTGILNAQRATAMSVEEYEASVDRADITPSTNSLLEDSLSALITSFRSTVNNELMIETNGKTKVTNIANNGINLNGFNVDFVENTTRTSRVGTFTDNKYFKNNRIAVKVLESNGKFPRAAISITSADGKSTITYEVRGNVSVGDDKRETFQEGIPLTITNISKRLGKDEAARLFRGFGFPESVTHPLYLDTIIETLKTADLKIEANIGTTIIDGKDYDTTLENMYINMLYSMLLNGDPRRGAVANARRIIHAQAAETGLAYNPIEVFYGYKGALADVILRTEGELGRKYILGFNNEKLATKTSASHMKLTNKIIDQVTEKSIHFGNVLTAGNRQYNVGKETFVKGGIKVGDKSKTVLGLTEKENSILAIESAFVQIAARSTKFNRVLVQIGTQSDRLHPQYTEFTAIGDKSNIFLKDEATGRLDSKTLAQRALYVHKNYYSNLDKIATAEWNKTIAGMGKVSVLKNLSDVANYLYHFPIPYAELKAESYLTSMSMVNEGPDGMAVVPEETLQAIAIFTNDELGLEYIETMRKMFRAQLDKAGYSAISNISRDAMRKIMGDSGLSTSIATDTAFDAYFYNAQILGVSALNLHTGGVAQYDIKKRSVPFFETMISFADGQLDVKSILTQARKLEVPGSKLSLGKISIDELLALRTKSTESGVLNSQKTKLDRLAYMKVILENKTSFPTDADKAKALMFNDFTYQQNEKLASQAKRNQVLGTAMQLPRIGTVNEPGFFLSKSVKTITVEDDQFVLDVLGVSGKSKATTATDGVQMITPLEIIKMNNSVGNNESSFKYNGVAIKSLTIDVDERGVTRIQKKAEFGSMDNDLVLRGSIELDQMLKRAYTAISFTSKQMLVDTEGAPTWHKLTPELWKKHGVSYGLVKYNDPINGPRMVHSTEILNSIRLNRNDARNQFERDLLAGLYESAKVEETFNNVYELWEHLGAHTNPKGWAQVAQIIGNHSGISTQDLALRDAEYPNRDAYIGKIGYTSQEKSGSKNVISWDNLLDNNYKFSEVDQEGRQHNRWSEVSNEHHGLILQAEHNYDTTLASSALDNDSSSEGHDSEVSLITQIISAAIAEGISVEEAQNISSTLNALSRAALDGFNSQLVDSIIKLHPDLVDQRENILHRLVSGSKDNTTQFDEVIKESLLTFTRGLLSETLSKRQADSGLAADLLSISHIEALTFDQKQLLPLFQSQIFADFNTRAVKMKLAGGQSVVSPSHAFLPTYDLKLGKQTILTGLSRADMNKKFHGDSYRSLPDGSLQKNAINESYPLLPITDLSNVKLSDIVVRPDGTEAEYIQIRKELKEEYKLANNIKSIYDISTNGQSGSQYVETRLASGGYKYRFGNITKDDSRRLEWAKWVRYTPDGVEQNVFDTAEYRAYNSIAPISKAYIAGKTFDQYFELDLTKPLVTVKGKVHPKTFKPLGEEVPGLDQDIAKLVPENLLREYFFSVVDKTNAQLEFPTAILTSEQLAAFSAWRNASDILQKIESTYQWIGDKSITDPSLVLRFKAYLYNSLQDNTKGWVSTPAEVYMPHMQAKTFFLNDGKDGSMPDSLFDITGLNEIPSTTKLESMGVLTHSEVIAFSRNYEKAFDEFTKKGTGRYHSLTPAQQDMFTDGYVNRMLAIRDHMNKVFRSRVSKVYGLNRQAGSRKKTIDAAVNLFVFDKDGDIKYTLREAVNKRNISAINGSHYKFMSKLVDALKAEIALRDTDQGKRTHTRIVQDIRNEFINAKVKTLTNNFQKTLEFITARIPAQGKQSFINAKMKNFIFSSKNSVYGPLELILLAGLDYDIDKQNMMTWGVDKDGNIIDWAPYMDEKNKLSITKLNEIIAEHAEVISEHFDEQIAEAQKDLDKIIAEQLEGPKNGTEATELSTKRTKMENYLRATKERFEKALANSDRLNRINFTKAGQNFIVHNLIEVISNPKNAIEASTPISIDKPNAAVELPNISKLFTGKVSVEDLFASQQITSSANPYSTIQYEKLNMDGKSGISIYASDLKSYLAAFYATRTATEDEQIHTRLKSDLTNVLESQQVAFGVDNTALQFFKAKQTTVTLPWNEKDVYKPGDVVTKGKYNYTAIQDVPKGTETSNRTHWKLEATVTTMPYISNATRWNTSAIAKLNGTESIEAKDAYTELRKLAKDDTEGQVAVILKYMDSVQSFHKLAVERQAWEDLSQLLTAATDNAKELILGKIGANNTTNSLISTMIRMGVDMGDALKVINDDSIKAIIKKIEVSTDLKTKDEQGKKLAAEGIVQQEEYGIRLIDELKSIIPSVPGVNAEPEEIFNYLTNPARILHTYAKAAFEFSILAKSLGINQGLKNSADEVYMYIASINNAINKSIEDYNDATKTDKIDFKFDLADFVYAASKDDAESKALVGNLLSAMDKIRTGINVPFVLLKNSHYFGYFEALFQAKRVRDSLSSIDTQVERIIDGAKLKYAHRNITTPIYKGIADTVYAYGVLKYLQSQPNLILNGVEYDLSKARGDEETVGRYELIQNLPEILETIENNEFTRPLRLDRSKRDPMTGESVKLLKGRNLALVSSMELAKLQLGLKDIELTNPALYKALFVYSLITTKGSYGSGSYIGLFPIDEYLDFSRFLKDHMEDITNDINFNEEQAFILNPLLLPQVSTIKKAESLDPNEFANEDEYQGELYDNEATDFSDVGGNYTTPTSATTKLKYVLDDLNIARKKGTHFKHDFIRSKDNGLVYKWNETLEMFIPLTRLVPELAIPFSIPTNSVVTLKDAGYVEGFTIDFPNLNPIKDAMGKYSLPHDKGTVVAYITGRMKADAASDVSSLSRVVQKLIQSDSRASNKDVNSYIIKDAFGNYSVATKEDLEASNPGFEFDEGRVAVATKIFDPVATDIVPTQRVFVKGTSYFVNPVEGSEPINLALGKQARGTARAIYDEKTIKDILKTINTNRIQASYDLVTVDQEYNNFIEQLVTNLIAVDLGVDAKTADSIRQNVMSRSQADQLAVSRIRNNIATKLGHAPSPVSKLETLMEGQDGFVKLFSSFYEIPKRLQATPTFKAPNSDAITKAAYELLTKEVINNITKLSLAEFRTLINLVGVDDSVFDQYIRNVYLPETGLDSLALTSGELYLQQKDKIKASKQLAVLNDKIVKGKPVYLPPSMKYEYSKPASKQVMFALTKYLNSRLPGVKWSIMSEVEIKRKFGKQYVTNKGFFKMDGQVIINSDRATLETPLHEFGHIYLQYLLAEDLQEYQRVMKLAKDHDLFETMGKTYTSISSVDLAEEVFCELLSMSATNQLISHNDTYTAELLASMSDGNTPFGKVVQWFKNLFKSLFGIKDGINAEDWDSTINLNMSDSLSSVISTLADEIVFGKGSFLNDFSETAKDNVKKSRTASTLTIKEAKDILMARGYIEWYCV